MQVPDGTATILVDGESLETFPPRDGSPISTSVRTSSNCPSPLPTVSHPSTTFSYTGLNGIFSHIKTKPSPRQSLYTIVSVLFYAGLPENELL
jgi:hypothetical protein